MAEGMLLLFCPGTPLPAYSLSLVFFFGNGVKSFLGYMLISLVGNFFSKNDQVYCTQNLVFFHKNLISQIVISNKEKNIPFLLKREKNLKEGGLSRKKRRISASPPLRKSRVGR